MDEPSDYQAGVRAGLATSALAVACVAFINLLGVEKPLLAFVLAAMAVRGGVAPASVRSRARMAAFLGGGQLILLGILLVVFHERLAALVSALEKLG
jgi:hypothetical protein